MATKDFSTKPLSNSERLNEASLLLYRAIAINDLLFEASIHNTNSLSESTFSGTTDALNSILSEAKNLIDGVDQAKLNNVGANHD